MTGGALFRSITTSLMLAHKALGAKATTIWTIKCANTSTEKQQIKRNIPVQRAFRYSNFFYFFILLHNGDPLGPEAERL